ncbi:unnamed protein product [Cunninghamella blakesleeana]
MSSLIDKHIIKIYTQDTSFILIKQEKVIELFFDGTIKQQNDYKPSSKLKPIECYGIIGILSGFTKKYLIIISQVQQKGTVFDHSILTIEKTSCLALSEPSNNKKPNIKKEQDKIKNALLLHQPSLDRISNNNIVVKKNISPSPTPSLSSTTSTTSLPASAIAIATTTTGLSNIQIGNAALSPPKSLINNMNNMNNNSNNNTNHSKPSLTSNSSYSSSSTTTNTSLSPSPSFLNRFKKNPSDEKSIQLNKNDSNADLLLLQQQLQKEQQGIIHQLNDQINNLNTDSSIINENKKIINNNNNNNNKNLPLTDADQLDETIALEKRLLKEVTRLYSDSMFIFSYDFDITNSLQRNHDNKKKDSSLKKQSNIPLWKKVDHRFWWNEHLTQNFVSAKLDDWILPIMQGTIQIESCDIEGFLFTFVLISRRSRERAGLRYQRRGVNDQGQVANFVETEQMVIFNRENIHHVASFIQTRGSIPLFWSQSPYSLHPDPVLHRSDEENTEAIIKHFNQQEEFYGKQIAVSLVELNGREAIIGSEYRHYIEKIADPNINYVEFDFHRETKGMRYENISKLCDSLRDDMAKMAYFWEDDNDTVFCRQTGVFRTNCMDCLDRTNVVQSSFARSVLNLQLMRFGISEYPDKGIKYYENFERIFNNAWANNGDMISRAYTGTSALKGDFTRTGKRNITGLMNDASNSLARMYFNTIKDFWRQATVDYTLGYHKLDILRNIPESRQRTEEPGIEKWLDKIRSDAIKVSCEIVIADNEEKLHGWTLLSPKENMKGKNSSKRFEEKVVLLTSIAIYICSYNYQLEKVVQFKRVELDTIHQIQMGEYILSSLTPQARDPEQNYGFSIYYDSNGQIMRWNTGSIRNEHLNELNIDSDDEEKENMYHQHDKNDDHPTTTNLRKEIEENDGNESDSSTSTSSSSSSSASSLHDNMGLSNHAILTFKAVRYNDMDLLDKKNLTCKQQVEEIVDKIANQCGNIDNDKFIVHKPIISLAQAEKTDGIFKKMGYKLKHAIWV